MSLSHARYAAGPITVAEGWTLQRLTPPSALFGANGLRTGADGRVYIAQVVGSQITAVDVTTGETETISPMGGGIVAPDDLAFGPDGTIYATEVMNARVGVRERDGRTRVLRGDLPCANGITVHQGRLFVDEFRSDGRLMELDLAGGEPRVLLEDIPLPNALEMGPDGKLYFPVMGANAIWRIDPEGGTPETVVGDLGLPDSVKFDAEGQIVSTQVGSGEVLRIDPRTGRRTVVAALEPGLDNLTFVGERLFVSNIGGRVTEILSGGETRDLFPAGLTSPLDLAMDADGRLYVADGATLFAFAPGGERQTAGMMFSPGWPGSVRGLAAAGPGELVVTTASMEGTVARYRPADQQSEVLAEGFDEVYGVAIAPDGTVVVADRAAGRVVSLRSGEVDELARGLRQPVGVATGADGTCLVSESGGGRVVQLSGGRAETVLDGLDHPEGLLVRDRLVYVVDTGAKTLVEYDPERRSRRTIAADLPVGAPPGVVPKPLRGLPPFTGPVGPFAGLAAGPDGTLYLSADAEGSVLALRPS